MARYDVPQELRFQLLARVRVAKAFSSLEGRRNLVRIRLMAFYILFQSNPSHEEMAAFFASEAEFVTELVEVLHDEVNIPEDIRVLALRALAVQLLDRGRHTTVIAAVNSGGQSGLLSLLMHRAIASLASAVDTRHGHLQLRWFSSPVCAHKPLHRTSLHFWGS